MTVVHPLLKKIVSACESKLNAEINALTTGMNRNFEDVKASVATIAAFREVIAHCEQIQKQEE
jgi:hypothetical protein